MATARSHFGHRPLPLDSNLARSLGSLCPSPSAPSAPSRVCLCSGALLAAPSPRLAAVSSSASPSLAVTDLKPYVFPRDPGCPTATATTPLPHPHTASLACSSCGPAASPPPSKQPASQPASQHNYFPKPHLVLHYLSSTTTHRSHVHTPKPHPTTSPISLKPTRCLPPSPASPFSVFFHLNSIT